MEMTLSCQLQFLWCGLGALSSHLSQDKQLQMLIYFSEHYLFLCYLGSTLGYPMFLQFHGPRLSSDSHERTWQENHRGD